MVVRYLRNQGKMLTKIVTDTKYRLSCGEIVSGGHDWIDLPAITQRILLLKCYHTYMRIATSC